MLVVVVEVLGSVAQVWLMLIMGRKLPASSGSEG